MEVQHEALAEIIHVASLKYSLVRVETLAKVDASRIAGVAPCVVVFHHQTELLRLDRLAITEEILQLPVILIDIGKETVVFFLDVIVITVIAIRERDVRRQHLALAQDEIAKGVDLGIKAT